MARLRFASYTPYSVYVSHNGTVIERSTPPSNCSADRLRHLPVLQWSDGSLWDVGNLYIARRCKAVAGDALSFQTVKREADHLRAFASFLESNKLDWYQFGEEHDERVTYRFRGELLTARRKKRLKPSTVTARMAAVIRFYRWVNSQGLLADGAPPFENRFRKHRSTDRVGLERTVTAISTDLAIPNRQRGRRPNLEGGLRPVSRAHERLIMDLARSCTSLEFQLQLAVGFCTGARLQTILDLKIETLARALPAETEHGRYLPVGPNAAPPVATKYGINGRILIPTALREQLLDYATSERRLRRVEKALPQDQSLLFLNRNGAPYLPTNPRGTTSINKDVARLRAAAATAGHNLSGFYFHCTRATFATNLAVVGLSIKGLPPIAVMRRIKELMLHRNESEAQRYIDYAHETSVQIAVEDAYAEWLFADIERRRT